MNLRPTVAATLNTPEEIRRGRTLQWWHENKHQWPHVYPKAKAKLCAQGTQCDVERNFSHGGIILNDLRNALDDETFHMILFLYENRHLWGPGDALAVFAPN